MSEHDLLISGLFVGSATPRARSRTSSRARPTTVWRPSTVTSANTIASATAVWKDSRPSRPRTPWVAACPWSGSILRSMICWRKNVADLVLPRITLGPQRREDGLCRGAIPAVALWPRHGRQSRQTVSMHRDVGSVTWAGRGCQQVQEETEAGDDLCQASGPERGEGNCPIRVLPATLRSPGRRIGQRGDATRAPSEGPRPGWAAGCRPSAFPGLAGKR